jgi:hypothetical protein
VQDEVEEFRAEFTLMERVPVDAGPLTALDLSNARLRIIDLSAYTALKHLRCVCARACVCVERGGREEGGREEGGRE